MALGTASDTRPAEAASVWAVSDTCPMGRSVPLLLTDTPQPAAIGASPGAEFFDEAAVMFDTFAPLDLGGAGPAAENPAYAWTWAGLMLRETTTRLCSPIPERRRWA
jgi:hypothetical protein